MVAMVSKEEIRQNMKGLRSALSADQVAHAGLSIVRHFHRMRYGISWLLYAPLPTEISTWGLFAFAKELRKEKVFMPRIQGNELDFREVQSPQDLKKGEFTQEPPIGAKEWDPSQPAIVVVPGLAFNSTGDRVGFGKGFYDRFLAQYPHLPRLAVAYDFQIMPQAHWDTSKTDMKMDFVVTPAGIWGTSRILS